MISVEEIPAGTADRTALRMSATLLFAGVVVTLVAGLFHADAANANDHVASFTEYARSGIWTLALALYGALQAVDGVALKHAVDFYEAKALDLLSS